MKSQAKHKLCSKDSKYRRWRKSDHPKLPFSYDSLLLDG